MLTLDATALARASASEAGIHWLVDLDFSTGLVYFTTWAFNISFGGNTYLGLGDLVSIAQMSESENQSADKLVIGASIVNTSMLAALIGPATVYRNRRVRIRAQFIDTTFQPDGAAVLRWSGYMDKVTVERKPANPEGGGATGKINLECWRAGQSRMRNASSLRRTHAQQMQRTANADTGLRYTQQLIEQPAMWVSTRFQQV